MYIIFIYILRFFYVHLIGKCTLSEDVCVRVHVCTRVYVSVHAYIYIVIVENAIQMHTYI